MNNTTSKVQVKNENGKDFIEFSGDVFIIPNRAIKAKDNYHDETDFFKKLSERNDIQFDEDDKFIQCWIVSDELDTENLNDHGGSVVLNEGGNTFIIYADSKAQYIPGKLFRNRKEGDIITYIATGYISDYRGKIIQSNVELRMKLKLNQTGYRYRSFGLFEEVLERVTH